MHSNRFLLWIWETCNKLLPDYKILCKQSFVTFPADCPCSQLPLYLQCRNTWNIYSKGRELVTLQILEHVTKSPKISVCAKQSFSWICVYLHTWKGTLCACQTFKFFVHKSFKAVKIFHHYFVFLFSLLLVKSNSFGKLHLTSTFCLQLSALSATDSNWLNDILMEWKNFEYLGREDTDFNLLLKI